MNLLMNLLQVSMNVSGILHDCSTRKNGGLLIDPSVSLENLMTMKHNSSVAWKLQQIADIIRFYQQFHT